MAKSQLFHQRPFYEPLEDASDDDELERRDQTQRPERSFSWIEYGIFLLLGVAMLWAWNMFLAAAPYFQRRFRTSKTLLRQFQPTEVSVSTVANLGMMIILSKLQARASYPRRIIVALVILTASFSLLAISTKAFRAVSAEGYFGFFVVMVCISSIAVGIMQNGVFSFMTGYGRPEYIQAIMTGQAVAGVLPPLVQIVSILSAPGDAGAIEKEASTAALAYFLTATGVSAITLLAFVYLLRLHPKTRQIESALSSASSMTASDDRHNEDASSTDPPKGDSIPLTLLGRKLFFRAAAVFFTFAVTMVFPVFTQEITSAAPGRSALYQKDAFIPLAFLVWNAGDLAGRLIPLASRVSLADRPRILLVLSLLRVVFIPLYLICNITNPAEAKSDALGTTMPDAFYLIIVQLGFGLTNGYLGSCCMMGAGDQVDEHEKEAAGGFMGLFLVGGLAVGSLCSFFVGNG